MGTTGDGVVLGEVWTETGARTLTDQAGDVVAVLLVGLVVSWFGAQVLVPDVCVPSADGFACVEVRR